MKNKKLAVVDADEKSEAIPEMSSLSKSREVDTFPSIESPFSIRSMFWRARHLDDSPMLEHLPFLFWLVEAQRPRLHVSLGVGDGVGYFGICQAIDRLEPEARNVGIDYPPENKRSKWAAIIAANEDFYSSNSKLIESPPEKFEPEFKKGSVDLLLIYDEISSSLSERILENWLPCLSSRGIIIFHGVMRPGFGKSPGGALLERFCKDHPSIRFETGDGIEVVLLGEEQDNFLRNFASLSVEDSSYNLVHAIFARLGAAHRFEWVSRSSQTIARAAEARAKVAETEREELSGKLAGLERDYAERNRRASELQVAYFDMEQLRTAAAAERDRGQQEASALSARLGELEAALSDTAAERDRGQQEASALSARLGELEDRLSDATNRSEATRRFLESVEEQLSQFTSTAHAQSQENSHLKTKLREAEIRLATREKELSTANTRIDDLILRLEASSSSKVAKNATEPEPNAQLSQQLETERAFIRALEPRFADLVKESLRLLETHRNQALALSEKTARNIALEQELESRATESIDIMRRLELRGTAMTSLHEENTRLKSNIAELRKNFEDISQKYHDIKNSTAWALTSPARSTVDWLRKPKA